MLEHNHPTTSETFARELRVKRLDHDQRKELKQVVDLNPLNERLLHLVHQKYGKALSLSDVRHLQSQLKLGSGKEVETLMESLATVEAIGHVRLVLAEVDGKSVPEIVAVDYLLDSVPIVDDVVPVHCPVDSVGSVPVVGDVVSVDCPVGSVPVVGDVVPVHCPVDSVGSVPVVSAVVPVDYLLDSVPIVDDVVSVHCHVGSVPVVSDVVDCPVGVTVDPVSSAPVVDVSGDRRLLSLVDASYMNVSIPSVRKRGRPWQLKTKSCERPKRMVINSSICYFCNRPEVERHLCIDGVMDWVGCLRCPRWFHVACVDVGCDFVCSFCR